jgi:hypothetical protein
MEAMVRRRMVVVVKDKARCGFDVRRLINMT